MKLPHRFENIAGLTLVALSLLATAPAMAQTIISNETLVTTTFVVNRKPATAYCGGTGCRATVSMFAPLLVSCPASTGQTCTFHISLDTKVSIGFANGCCTLGPTGFYQFLVDGVAPTIGPTTKHGDYLFEKNVLLSVPVASRQSYPASVLTAVTNSSSNSHTISVKLGCQDADNEGGCQATAYSTTMRVDVFEP